MYTAGTVAVGIICRQRFRYISSVNCQLSQLSTAKGLFDRFGINESLVYRPSSPVMAIPSVTQAHRSVYSVSLHMLLGGFLPVPIKYKKLSQPTHFHKHRLLEPHHAGARTSWKVDRALLADLNCERHSVRRRLLQRLLHALDSPLVHQEAVSHIKTGQARLHGWRTVLSPASSHCP